MYYTELVEDREQLVALKLYPKAQGGPSEPEEHKSSDTAQCTRAVLVPAIAKIGPLHFLILDHEVLAIFCDYVSRKREKHENE